MQNKMKHILSVLMVFVMVVSLTACGEEVTLESRTVNGVTLNVPSDLSAFADVEGDQRAQDENSLASITVSQKNDDAQGITAADYDQDTFQQSYMGSYTDVSFEKFDNGAQIDGKTALYTVVKATNPRNVKIVLHMYMVFFDDGKVQNIVIFYSDENDNSVKTNIDNIIKSIKIA